jgi:hypothetical protein
MDSYILHSPLPTIEGTLEAWRVLVALQDEGKVRTIGVSNTYDVGVLETLARERQVQVVQNRWYEGNNWDHDVCAYCRQHGIQYQLRFSFSFSYLGRMLIHVFYFYGYLNRKKIILDPQWLPTLTQNRRPTRHCARRRLHTRPGPFPPRTEARGNASMRHDQRAAYARGCRG